MRTVINSLLWLLLFIHVSLITGVVGSECPSEAACLSDSPYKTNICCSDYTTYKEVGGISQEVTVDRFPVIKDTIALAYLNLTRYCLREIHWHANAEIAYVISGSARVGVVGVGGRDSSFFNVSKGDAWFFPQGFVQYFQAGPDGVEVVLWFTRDTIETVTMPHSLKAMPENEMAKSFFINDTRQFFDNWSPSINGTTCPKIPPTWTIPADNRCEGNLSRYKFHVNCSNNPGTVRDKCGNLVLEASDGTFPILKDSTVSYAYALIKPQCHRVMHWHPVQAEFALVLQGTASIGMFGFGKEKESFFNVTVGDIWFFPVGFLQYITSLDPLTGPDFIAILGFSTSSLQSITAAGGLAPVPVDVQKLSLGVDDTTFRLLSETNDPFTCPKPYPHCASVSNEQQQPPHGAMKIVDELDAAAKN
jgi:oxalate decarboxylase